jgi:hypothetical protein
MGPAGETPGVDVVDIHIARGERAVDRHRELVPARLEARVADAPLRQPRGLERVVTQRVEEMQAAAAVFVQDVGDVATVGADVEVLDVPGDLGSDQAVLMGDRVLELELRELAALVREHIDAAPARGEPRDADAGLHRFLLERGEAAGGDVGDVQVALGDRDIFPHQQLRVVARPVERIPGIVAAADQQLRRRGGADVGDVHVVTGYVALVAVESDALAVVRPHRAAVDEVAVGELAHGTIGGPVEHLRVLIPGLVLEEHHSGAYLGRARPFDGIGIERQLLAHAERRGHAVHLLALAEACQDQEAPVGLPVEKGRAARLLVALEHRGECRIGQWNAVEDQAAALAVLRGDSCGERAGCGPGGRRVRRGRACLRLCRRRSGLWLRGRWRAHDRRLREGRRQAG